MRVEAAITGNLHKFMEQQKAAAEAAAKARAEGKAEKGNRNNRRGKNGKVKGLKDVSRV